VRAGALGLQQQCVGRDDAGLCLSRALIVCLEPIGRGLCCVCGAVSWGGSRIGAQKLISCSLVLCGRNVICCLYSNTLVVHSRAFMIFIGWGKAVGLGLPWPPARQFWRGMRDSLCCVSSWGLDGLSI